MIYRKQTEKLLDWNIRSYDYKTVEESKVADGYETSNVWKIDPCFDKVHSAIFPVELCKRVIQYYSYKNDLIFDPFGGSGTVGRTAKALGRLFFLTEQEPKYSEYMRSKQREQSMFKERKSQFLTLKVNWVALRDENGYKKFGEILQKLNIPNKKYNGNLEKDLARILGNLL
ncbi:MAG: site-specific DNA-methyltransferase [Bacteroidales bacterium]|jgi:DNA modification methylase|nr:site-specific DNA-methyltransferase [Bacteroidales bacterium]